MVLDATQTREEHPAHLMEVTSGSLGRPTVWVVDDSPLEAGLACRALVDCDVEVMSDGSVALEQLAAGRAPDLLVLDWHMPGISGIDVCQFLRGKPATQSLPVLMLTVQQHTRDLVEALAAGCDDYVTKPFKAPELAARAAALIRSKRLRDRLERAERTTHQLLEHHPDALVTIDAERRLTFVNAEARRMLAPYGEDLTSRRVSDVLPDLALDAIPKTGDLDLYPLPDVRIGDAIYSPVVRMLPSGAATDVTISFRNVTDRRRLEARRLDFYSIIAHDLRAPLSAVMLKTDYILRGKRGEVPDTVRADLVASKRRIEGLLSMVDDFLDLARIEATSIAIEEGEVDLGALANDAVEDLRPLAQLRDVRVQVDLPRACTLFAGDERRLRQVFSNLVSNAIKFSPDGGVVIVSGADDGGWLVVSVKDSGRGIAADVLPTLFQRYARALDRHHPVAGTGLGLMIVREIVEAHGGTVWAESTEGAGSTFRFRLSRDARPAGKAAR